MKMIDFSVKNLQVNYWVRSKNYSSLYFCKICSLASFLCMAQVKQMDYPTERVEDDHNSKFLSEIYLTRLLMTKVISTT